MFQKGVVSKLKSTEAEHRIADAVFFLILILFTLYGIRFIQLTSFLVDGERYYVLFDDAMISMTFAKNLASGDGLVWNAGERVEGFTNPLWVGIMALFHLLPLPISKISLPIQFTGLVLLFVNLIFVRRVALRVSGNAWVALGATFLSAFFFSLNNWTLQGMEVGLLTLLITVTVWLYLRMLETGRFSAVIFWILAVGTLVRMDTAVPMLVVIGAMALIDPTNRRQHLVWGLGLLGVFLAGQTFARYIYYGEWLPNTYYLKVAGIPLLTRVRRGVGVFRQFVWTTGWFLFALPFLVFVIKPSKRAALLLSVWLGQVAYSMYVGGDAWEHRGGANRFISVAMPIFFVLFAFGAELGRQAIVRAATIPKDWMRRLSQGGFIAVIVLSLFSFNTILSNDPADKWLLEKRPIFVNGTERLTHIGLTVGRVTTPGAKVAVVSAGAIPYFSERYAIDLWGKIDEVIAHSKPRNPRGALEYADYRPGHIKWDYQYSLGKLQPDVIAQLVDDTIPEARPFLEGRYTRVEMKSEHVSFPIYVRNDSPYIKWEQLEARSQQQEIISRQD